MRTENAKPTKRLGGVVLAHPVHQMKDERWKMEDGR
jgi:hypothetical protein